MDTICTAFFPIHGCPRITHPWTTRVTNNFESTRTPSKSQRPLTVELTSHFPFDNDPCAEMGCEGEDGVVVVVFEGLLGWQGARLVAGGVEMELSLRV